MAANNSTKKRTDFDTLIGNKFGQLTILSVIKVQGCRINPKRTKMKCQCDCGNIIITDAARVKSGGVLSCGCFQKERVRETKTIHGENTKSGTTAEYRTWSSMKNRTLNQDSPRYAEWGGKGITICERWLGKNGYQNFLADMGRKPSPQHSIDRYPNPYGNYEPSNTRWATPKEQSSNRRNTRFITWQGETLCAKDWAKKLGMSRHALINRIENWPLERAMTELLHRN